LFAGNIFKQTAWHLAMEKRGWGFRVGKTIGNLLIGKLPLRGGSHGMSMTAPLIADGIRSTLAQAKKAPN
jgi:hypothetical protein